MSDLLIVSDTTRPLLAGNGARLHGTAAATAAETVAVTVNDQDSTLLQQNQCTQNLCAKRQEVLRSCTGYRSCMHTSPAVFQLACLGYSQCCAARASYVNNYTIMQLHCSSNCHNAVHHKTSPCDSPQQCLLSSCCITHPLLARYPCTASTATYILLADWLRALPPRAYLLTHVDPSTLSDLIRGIRVLSYTSCRK